MSSRSLIEKAVRAVDARGALLVFPINNRSSPKSLWSELHPRTKMRWEWDEDGDSRVADLWHLRERLSRSRRVIYSKWYQGRATLFACDVFVDLLAFLRAPALAEKGLPYDSREALDLLLSDSPLSTRQLKAAAGLEGRLLEPAYNRALRPLWNHLLIIGFGEFDDSSFPSLGLAATQTLFEEFWQRASARSPEAAGQALASRLGRENPFWIQARKLAGRSLAP